MGSGLGSVPRQHDLFNHANLHANTGDNDVSSIDYVSASYGGHRNVQVALRFEF